MDFRKLIMEIGPNKISEIRLKIFYVKVTWIASKGSEIKI